MDLWVAAAAAGAGYLAKYWQDAKESEGLSESPLQNSENNKSKFTPSLTNIFDQKRDELGGLDNSDRRCPFRRWPRRKSGKQASSYIEEDERLSDASRLDISGSPTNETALTSHVANETPSSLRKHEEGNVLSLSSLQLHFSRNDNHQEDGNRTDGIGDYADTSGCETNDQANLLQPVGMDCGFGRGRNSLNSKRSRGFFVKPLSSLESCAIAQLSKECVQMESHVFSSIPSPSTLNAGSFFRSDKQKIRNSNSDKDHLSLQSENGEHKFKIEDGADLRVKDTLIGFPPHFEAGLVELPRKPKRRRGKVWQQRSDISNTHRSGKHFHPQGSSDGELPFCLGISIGMMSTILWNKKEVEKLNESLKQTQNLVRDLHEELEMTDSLNVKELANEDCRFQEHNESYADIKEPVSTLYNEAPTAFSPAQEADVLIEYYEDKAHIQEEGENEESMSKIEAELEAELARLELNINGSSLERRLPEFDELNPDLVGDIIHGELKANMVNGAFDSDRDACSSSTTHEHPTNYAVSPRELSLRLHELIQLRLEERVAELEYALLDSQKKLLTMEAELENSQRGFSSSDIGSFSTHESPTMMEHADSMSPPLFLNLPDNALKPHNENCAGFMKITETSEADPCKQINDEGPHQLDRIPYKGCIGNGENRSLLHLDIDERELNKLHENEDDDDDDDELGKLLIKQIVEKARQGSPVVRNAQRWLFSVDMNNSQFK